MKKPRLIGLIHTLSKEHPYALIDQEIRKDYTFRTEFGDKEYYPPKICHTEKEYKEYLSEIEMFKVLVLINTKLLTMRIWTGDE